MTDVKRLSVLDAALLGMETADTLIHIGGAVIFKIPDGSPPDYVRRLYDKWRRRPVDRPPFNYRLSNSMLGKMRPTWELLDDVDLGGHLFHIGLPYPGTDQELLELLGQLHSVQLNRTRPLWEIHLIEGLKGDRFAMYVKIHHALVDGASAIRVFTETFSRDPKKADAPPVWAARPQATGKRKSGADGSEFELPNLVESVTDGYKALQRLFTNAGKLGRAALNFGELTPPDYAAPDTILNRPITARRTMGVVSFDFSRVRQLSKMAGCTINDIVLTVCGGALRRFLQLMGELPKASLVACVPISLKPEGYEEGGNTASAIPVALGTDEVTVDARFDAVRESAAKGKEFIRKLPPTAAQILTALLVVPVLIEAVQGKRPLRRPQYNLIISNVPGYREPLYLNGAKMLETIPFALILRGMAMNITVLSMQDRLCLAVTACPDTVPEVHRLVPLLTKGMSEVEAMIARRAKTRAADASKGGRKKGPSSAKAPRAKARTGVASEARKTSAPPRIKKTKGRRTTV